MTGTAQELASGSEAFAWRLRGHLYRRIRQAGAARGVLGVTLGHLVAGPLYAFNTHVIPRVVPLGLAMAMFQEDRR